MSQNLSFTQSVNKLFFGVDISTKSIHILDSFLNISILHHSDKVSRQSNLNISMEMNTDKQAWASKHIFNFKESPLADLKINKGIIEVTIGEAGEIRKVLNLNWELQFDSKVDATIYFDRLKEIFSKISTDKKIEEDNIVGQIAKFSNDKQTDKDLRTVIFFLNQSNETKKYELSLIFSNELLDE